MKTSHISVPLLLFVLNIFSYGQNITTAISLDSLRNHMLRLADDSLQGRGIGTTGSMIAADYIKQALKSYGVNPPKNLPQYFQTFPLHGSRLAEGTDFTLYCGNESQSLRMNDDYLLYSSGAQTFIPAPVRTVFVGYGIIAPEFNYNDYRNIDVQNAVVVFFSGEPHSNDESFFDGDRSTVHSSFILKQKIALARGAKGSILLPNPNDPAMNNWEEQRKEFLFEETRLLITPPENMNAMINPKFGRMLFSGSEYSFEEITRREKSGRLKSFTLRTTVQFQGKFKERDFLSSNVIGIVEGSDPVLKDSYVLLSAHYDHLGIGPAVNGDSIYNGLIDNASGVSALLEIARGVSQTQQRPLRSILFVFLTGEERGFLGSQYYCLNPIVPLHKTVANINIDGLSLFERVRSVIGVGSDYSTLGAFLYNVVTPLGITIDEIPVDLFRNDQFRNSDQFMFAQAGIPSMLVAEGLQYEHSSYDAGVRRYVSWSEEKYHTPFDDPTQPINYEAAVQHTDILFRFALSIANSRQEPQWFSNAPFIAERLKTMKEGK